MIGALAARQSRSFQFSAWLLYICLLLNAGACALSQGQQAALQLSGLEAGFCADSQSLDRGVHWAASAEAGCALSSVFTALLLAAFFGLLGLLPQAGAPMRWLARVACGVRERWPAANPRASPKAVLIV